MKTVGYGIIGCGMISEIHAKALSEIPEAKLIAGFAPVPGSAPAAVLLAARLMHGYRPGPLLLRDYPDVVYKIGIYLLFASVTMWVLAQLLSKVSVKILRINKHILMPVIFCLCVVGSYLINFNLVDVKVMFFFGLVGLLLTWADGPLAPFLL